MRGLRFEAKKIVFPRWFIIVALALLLMVNGYVLQNTLLRQTTIYRTFGPGFDTVYTHAEGPITMENMNWVVEEHDRLNKIVEGGNFSTEEHQPGTYTGWVFLDCNLINKLYNEAKYAFEYSQFGQSVYESAQVNADRCFSKGNIRQSQYFAAMGDAFQGREIRNFYRTEGYKEYFSYSFSNLVSLLMILLATSGMFAQERETGMDVLLKMTSNGVKAARIHKFVSGFLFAWGIATVFALQNFMAFFIRYGFRGMGNPLYAVQDFQTTGLRCSIAQSILMNYMMNLLGTWTFTALILLISSLAKNNLISVSLGFGILAGSVLVDIFYPQYSFFSLMNGINECKSFSWLLGMPRINWQVLGHLIGIVICVTITCLIDMYQNRRLTGRRAT